jgi:hypothetical protein
MGKHTWAVFTNPVPGKEDEYNRWYNDVHLGDVVKVPGIVGAQRFALSQNQMVQDPETLELGTKQTEKASLPWKYVAFYEIDTDDLDGVFKELAGRAGTDQMPLSDALGERVATWCFQAVSPKVTPK